MSEFEDSVKRKVAHHVQAIIQEKSDKAIVEGITRALRFEHRTNQATFIRALIEALECYGKIETDSRNKNAVSWAKQASEIDIFIPYV